jgi:hypothetical protein
MQTEAYTGEAVLMAWSQDFGYASYYCDWQKWGKDEMPRILGSLSITEDGMMAYATCLPGIHYTKVVVDELGVLAEMSDYIHPRRKTTTRQSDKEVI